MEHEGTTALRGCAVDKREDRQREILGRPWGRQRFKSAYEDSGNRVALLSCDGRSWFARTLGRDWVLQLGFIGTLDREWVVQILSFGLLYSSFLGCNDTFLSFFDFFGCFQSSPSFYFSRMNTHDS